VVTGDQTGGMTSHGQQVVMGGQMVEMDGHGQEVIVGGQMGGMDGHGQQVVIGGQMSSGHTVDENGQILDANGQIVGMVPDGNVVMGVMDDSMMSHSRKRRHDVEGNPGNVVGFLGGSMSQNRERRHDEFMPRHAAPLYCGIEYGPHWIEVPSSGEIIDGSSGSVSFILTAVSSSRVTTINYHGPRGLECGSLTTTQVTSLSPINRLTSMVFKMVNLELKMGFQTRTCTWTLTGEQQLISRHQICAQGKVQLFLQSNPPNIRRDLTSTCERVDTFFS